MENLRIYDRVRQVPDNAKKTITGGRLNGMTDVAPMFRIKTMTDLFGPCGLGWGYTRPEFTIVDGAGGEKMVQCYLEIWYKETDYDEEGKVTQVRQSDKVPGIGGSMLIANEKNGLRSDDEAYKKAMTDALSVACKALGVAADVYWDKDSTKYTQPEQQPAQQPKQPKQPKPQPRPVEQRKVFKADWAGSDDLMKWLYNRRKDGQSLREALTKGYIIEETLLQQTLDNFEQYLINNNLS